MSCVSPRAVASPAGVSSPSERPRPAVQPVAEWGKTDDFSSNRPPFYLQFGTGDSEPNAIDRELKERYLRVPVYQLRRNAAVLDPEMTRLRTKLTEETVTNKGQALRAKRLERRCRVKAGECVDDLSDSYAGSPHLERLPDPADNDLHQPTTPSRDFFRQLGRRRVAGGAPLAP